ncbi:cytochrome c oxidase assembly factor CtaG [Paenibacillus agilis]|uniref:Cytochrome c oxidase assembly factor CtaG n=1 Tax=Paenibacillus agilis TaxID=3020863 RepID=A0A559IKQ0_9BACL|nr:cytochrome c oxidase assembly factor CtaG [Paenibacillus agilis]TVX88235.1 cytochrome c oxidase assembly factor CtaG [Paenibacillus agilis]
MFGLEQFFSFADLWSPLFLVAALLVIVLYLGLTGYFRDRFPGSRPVTRGQRVSFIVGVLLIYLSQGGPIDLMGHLMFTFHMVMMSLCYIIAPPLLLIGIPDWMWRFLLDRPLLRKLKWMMHPILTAVLFNALFSFYHIPAVHDYVMLNYGVHTLYYIALYIAAFMMWWPVVNPVPEWNLISDVKKMGYIFLNGLLITPACALLIFADESLYATYNDPNTWAAAMGYCVSGSPEALLAAFDGPQFFSWFDVREDQQLGGILMKLVQETMYGIILAYVFSRWFRREGKDDDVADSTPKSDWQNA